MDKKDLQRLQKNLPEHPHILCMDKFFNSAVIVPLIWKAGEYHLLFQERAPGIRQGTEIGFPGGKIEESDQNSQETAVREAIEELGIAEEKIQIKGRFDTLVAPLGATVEPFLAELSIESLDEFQLNPDEVARVFTLPVATFFKEPEVYYVWAEVRSSITKKDGTEEVLLPSEELGLPEIYHKPWGGKKFPVYAFPTDEALVWGITAEIIMAMVKMLKKSHALESTD